jgi:signal peptidase II
MFPQALTAVQKTGIWVIIVTFIADQASKLWLLFGFDLAQNGPVDFGPYVEIVLAWNRGISYGLFQQDTDWGRWLLVLASLAAVIWLGRWMWREPSKLGVIALSLIIGGALGNAVDRIAYGAVTDFVHLHYGDLSWYIFNIADAAIVAGVIGLLYESFRPQKPEGTSAS